MSFEDLPAQTPLFEQADAYGASCLRNGRAALAEVNARTDIAFGPDYWQKLDVFAPKSGGSGLPVVLFFHGGGWSHGYKEWCSFMAPALTAAPAIFVSASYRLIPATDYEGVMADARAALAWITANIAGLGGDPARIWVGGHSAGGQIAALLALEADPDDTPIKGCLPISGTFGKDSVMPKDAAGKVIRTVPITPPLTKVTGPGVPFFLTWGSLEDEKIRRWGREMTAALEAAGTAAEALELAGEDHFTIHENTGNPEDIWTRTVRARIAG